MSSEQTDNPDAPEMSARTIGRAAKSFHLSRSALLYYDRIGLLSPSVRLENGYRLYSPEDMRRLGKICEFRRAGLKLRDIQCALGANETGLQKVLNHRLLELAHEIEDLEKQQRFILGILKSEQLLGKSPRLNREVWKSVLKECGFSGDDMNRWHHHFEVVSPVGHQAFLEFLGLPESEIERIRSKSAGTGRRIEDSKPDP